MAKQQLMKKRGRTKAFSCLTSVWVRGKEVPVTPEEINSIYWNEPIPCHPIFRNKVESQFQWVVNLIAKGLPQWATSKGLIHQHDLKFEARIWLDLVCSRIMPSLNISKVPIEVVILIACIMDHVHINVGEIIADQFKHKAKKQATALPFPSLGAIKKSLQPTKDKLASLCSTVDVLERKAVPEAPRSPPDNWWVGYNNESKQVSDEEPHHRRPPPPLMRSVYDVDPSWTPGGVVTTSYHEFCTLPENWVVRGPGKPLSLPSDPQQPIAEETASWQFDAATYTWKPRPNH
ncbi:hypothetical protein HAX54_047131 [Datura stramonium]|uniref:Putative plant transposon protein domain-containing protein n=1 Tax=Datura stramonium TaxID=4076 RepID=A0ABS8SS65_DATST|nr:hypothetical protein [Datura stramonium]